jgi:hypothetical protein
MWLILHGTGREKIKFSDLIFSTSAAAAHFDRHFTAQIKLDKHSFDLLIFRHVLLI